MLQKMPKCFVDHFKSLPDHLYCRNSPTTNTKFLAKEEAKNMRFIQINSFYKKQFLCFNVPKLKEDHDWNEVKALAPNFIVTHGNKNSLFYLLESDFSTTNVELFRLYSLIKQAYQIALDAEKCGNFGLYVNPYAGEIVTLSTEPVQLIKMIDHLSTKLKNFVISENNALTNRQKEFDLIHMIEVWAEGVADIYTSKEEYKKDLDAHVDALNNHFIIPIAQDDLARIKQNLLYRTWEHLDNFNKWLLYEKAYMLLKEGKTSREVGRELNVDQSTVLRWRDEYKKHCKRISNYLKKCEEIEEVDPAEGERGKRQQVYYFKKAGKSAKEIAEKVGVSVSTVYRWIEDLKHPDLIKVEPVPVVLTTTQVQIYELLFEGCGIEEIMETFSLPRYQVADCYNKFKAMDVIRLEEVKTAIQNLSEFTFPKNMNR